MPTYDYVCKFCDHTFEHFQGINDALLKKCPECERRGLERQFGIGAGVVFKGSGFYETDYKKKSKKGSESGTDAPEKKESSAKKDKQPGADSKATPKSGDAKKPLDQKSKD